MDPEEALRQMRALAKQMDVEDAPVGFARGATFIQHARDLAEQFRALDEWLSKGGFLPRDWATRED